MLFFSNGNQEQELQVWLVSVMKFTEFNSVMYDISQTVKCNMITVKWKPNTDDFTLMLWDRENKRNKYSKSKLLKKKKKSNPSNNSSYFRHFV